MDELLLLSGNDIPFPIARLTIHQPTLKEIAYINEEKFWPGCEFLKFNKDILSDEDKIDLSNQSNFNIIMSMIQEKNIESLQARLNVLSVLALIFPTSKIKFGKNMIQIRNQQTNEIGEINNDNFENFKEILIDMFCLTNQNDKQYNPAGDLAKKIANKIMRGRQERAKLAPETTKIAILSRYASILAVGEKKDLNDLMNYTVYQIMDEFKRFKLKQEYDSWVKYKIAGAKDLQDPQDWFKDIHEK